MKLHIYLTTLEYLFSLRWICQHHGHKVTLSHGSFVYMYDTHWSNKNILYIMHTSDLLKISSSSQIRPMCLFWRPITSTPPYRSSAFWAVNHYLFRNSEVLHSLHMDAHHRLYSLIVDNSEYIIASDIISSNATLPVNRLEQHTKIAFSQLVSYFLLLFFL